MEAKYKPLFGRVIIKRDVEEKRGSIILPDAKRHARSEGTVIAKGPTADETIEIGQRVIFGKHAGAWLDGTFSKMGDEDGTIFICQDEDILAIVEA